MSNFKKPRLWIVSELFYPDQTSTSYILSKIANRMSDKYEVNVVTDSELYQDIKATPSSYFTINDNIKIFKLKTKKRDKNKLSQRGLKTITLSLAIFNLLNKKVQKGEKVFIVTNPAPFLILAPLIKKWKDLELFVLVHDVFPENTIPSGLIKSDKSFLYRIVSAIYNKAYSSADHLIVLGRDMKEIVQKKIKNKRIKTKIHIIENWGDTININPLLHLPNILDERHKNELLTIQYAGNIGRVQGLNYFIDLLNECGNKKLCFDLYGNGALKQTLMEKAQSLNITEQVNFYGSYSRDEQNEILNSCDIALVTLSKGMYGLGVPSKTYNIMAAGIPILFIGELNSEIALMLKENNCGFCFDPLDKTSILNFLNNLSFEHLPKLKKKGLKSRQTVLNKYSENYILDKFSEII